MIYDEVMCGHYVAIVYWKMRHILLIVAKAIEILLGVGLGIGIVAGPDKTGLVEDAERAQEKLDGC
jgi:hypothetical protein